MLHLLSSTSEVTKLIKRHIGKTMQNTRLMHNIEFRSYSALLGFLFSQCNVDPMETFHG